MYSGMVGLVQQILTGHETRVKDLTNIGHDVGNQRQRTRTQMYATHKDRRNMAREIRSTLAEARSKVAQAEASRKEEVSGFMDDLAHSSQVRTKELRKELSQVLANLKEAQGRVQDQLHAEMAQLTEARKTMAGILHEKLSEVGDMRRRQTAELLKEIADDHQAARKAWHDMKATVVSKRNGAPARNGASGRNQTPLPADGAFKYLADHPDGTSLAELEEALQLNRFQAVKATKSLMEEGKVEKRGLMYFAL